MLRVHMLVLACYGTVGTLAQPTVESDGNNLVLKTGDGGEISFTSMAGSMEQTISLTELRQALTDIVRTRAIIGATCRWVSTKLQGRQTRSRYTYMHPPIGYSIL